MKVFRDRHLPISERLRNTKNETNLYLNKQPGFTDGDGASLVWETRNLAALELKKNVTAVLCALVRAPSRFRVESRLPNRSGRPFFTVDHVMFRAHRVSKVPTRSTFLRSVSQCVTQQ